MICITCQATVELWRFSWLRCKCTKINLYARGPLPRAWEKVQTCTAAEDLRPAAKALCQAQPREGA
jgi:hypothetical protein